MTTAATAITPLQGMPAHRANVNLETSPRTVQWAFNLLAHDVNKPFQSMEPSVSICEMISPVLETESHDTLSEMGNLQCEYRLRALQPIWYSTSPPSAFSDSLIVELEEPFDLLERYYAESLKRAQDASDVRRAYRRRIDELGRLAIEEDISWNEASEQDFWTFVGAPVSSRQSGLVLMDNGNLRAVWKGDDESHIGLHFLGSQWVRYVIFKRREASRHISRVAGTDTLEGIRKQIRAFDLVSLVNG